MNILTHKQLLDQASAKPAAWVVEGLVRTGSVGFIAGEPKVTKSWLALHMVQSVATGVPFMGTFAVLPSNVLYVQEEDAVETVMTRYRLMEKGHRLPLPPAVRITYAIQTGFKLDDVGAARDIIDTTNACGARLVIFDVLNKLHRGNDADQGHMTKVMGVIEELRRETGAAVLIVHHFSKGAPSRRGNQRMRGSSVLAGWSENSLYLSRLGGLTKVEVESKFAETPGFSYEFKAENEGLRLSIVEESVEAVPFRTRRAIKAEREARKRKLHVGGR